MVIAATEAEKAFMNELVQHKLLVPTGVSGVFGRGGVFEDVLTRFNDAVSALAKNDGADVYLFPPTLSRSVFEKSGFLDSFPQLAGSVFSFTGSEKDHKALVERVHASEPWGEYQTMTDVVLTPAACYPIYPTFTGTLPPGGRLVDMYAWVFRHEPSPDPARMQAFRVREFVRVGDADTVVDWRNMWLERGLQLLLSLGLDARSEAASDPFFGRGGRMLAATQREQMLKFEVVIPVCSKDKPTACCSFNYHQDKFGQTFDIKTSKGEVAQTACLGFGMERVVLALFKKHGPVPVEWPTQVRKQLWPSP